jgi:hypothetical protein
LRRAGTDGDYYTHADIYPNPNSNHHPVTDAYADSLSHSYAESVTNAYADSLSHSYAESVTNADSDQPARDRSSC